MTNRRIIKGQYGFPVITISPKEYLNKGAEVILKALEPVGKAVTKVVTALPSSGPTAMPYFPTTVEEVNRERQNQKMREKVFEEDIAPALSPSNHVVAWTQGSMNPKVGQRKIAEWGPLAQLGSLGVDAIGFKYAPKVVKGTSKAVVNTAAKAGNKTAKAYLISKEIGKGTINQKELSNQFIEPHVTNSKGSGKVVHYDNGDGKSVFRNSGAAIKDGKLVPGQTTRNQSNFTWWNQDNPYINVHKSQGRFSPSRYIITDQTNQFIQPLKAGKSVGQSNGTGRGFILPTELVSETPVSLENAQIWNKNPFGWWERVKSYQPKLQQDSPTSLKFFERQPSKISRSERAGVPKQERNFTPKRHIAYYPGYQLKGLMKGSPLEKQLSKAGTINVKQLRAHFNKASQIERDIVNQVLEDKVWGDNIDYNKFKKAVQDELITYDRKPQTKYSDYGMNRIGYDGDIRVPNNFSGYMEVVQYKFPNRFQRKSSTEFIDTETGQSVTPFNFHDYDNSVIASLQKDKVTKNTFTFESSRLPLGNGKHYDASTLGHSRTYTTPEEPKVLHVLESQSDWGQTKLGNNSAPYTGTTEYLNDPTAYRKFIDGHKRLLAKMQENPSDYQAGSIERQIANIEHHEAILKQMLKREGWNPQAKYLHDNYLQRQLQENLKYASERGQTLMRYPTSETAAKIEGYTRKSPSWEQIEALEKKYNRPEGYVDLGTRENFDFESLPEKEALELSERFKTYKKWDETQQAKDFWKEFNNIGDYYPQHQTILKKYSDFPKMFQKLFRGHPVEIVTDSKGNTWYQVNVPKGYLNKEWQFKKGGKTHKPFGHRSILDNGWQSTKQLKNKKNVYGK